MCNFQIIQPQAKSIKLQGQFHVNHVLARNSQHFPILNYKTE